MGEFREEFSANVRSALTHKGYRPEDFEMTQSTKGDFKIFRIVYQYQRAFSFQIQVRVRATVSMLKQSGEPEGTVHIFSSPGHLLSSEHEADVEPSALTSRISDWVERIDHELTTIPINRRIEEQRVRLEEFVAQYSDAAEGYFTTSQAQELRERLSAFEKQFAEAIKTSAEDSKEANRRISELHTEIELLKRQVDTLDRKGWTKSAMVRIGNWLTDPTNRQLLKSGSEVAKTILLPPGSGNDK